jgi:protein-L-isoaspartate O-methyltransferase
MTVYEIGANIGFFSLLAARLVGAAGPVTTFEADPEIVARLRSKRYRCKNMFGNRQAPHIIKCDVEGAEAEQPFRGATKLLE